MRQAQFVQQPAEAPEIAPTNHSQSGQPHEDEESSIDLENARNDVFRYTEVCRRFMSTLELTRMRKARIGRGLWLSACHIYQDDPPLARLWMTVDLWAPVVELLFRHVFLQLCILTRAAEIRAMRANNVRVIESEYDQLNLQLALFCERRRCTTLQAFANMQMEVEQIPISLPDADFEEMKQCIFGLTGDGNYFLGDDIHQTPIATGLDMIVAQVYSDILTSNSAHMHSFYRLSPQAILNELLDQDSSVSDPEIGRLDDLLD